MIKIKVPATSANLGPGFDCLGLALSLYNEFSFEKSDEFRFENMPVAYSNVNNLVVQSSLKTYEYLNIKPICYKMSTVDNVPVARGLGSSATCIVAGIIAASAPIANQTLIKVTVTASITPKITARESQTSSIGISNIKTSFYIDYCRKEMFLCFLIDVMKWNILVLI